MDASRGGMVRTIAAIPLASVNVSLAFSKPGARFSFAMVCIRSATAHICPMRPPRLGQNYAFVVAGVVFLTLMVAAAMRTSTGVLMTPWERAFGWDRATISLAAAVGIFLYGLAGPFAAAVMQSFGVRRTVVAALAVMAGATALTLAVREPWQLIATWGVLSGLASGCVAMVLAATVVNRWFVKRRGLVSGLLTASTASGTLLFLPVFGIVAERFGWKPVVMILGATMLAVIPLVLF